MKALFVATAAAIGLTSVAFADPPKSSGAAKPTKMSEEQLDKVAGGALLTVIAVDVVDVNRNDVNVQVPVAANVAAGVLCGTCAANQTANARPGRVNQ